MIYKLTSFLFCLTILSCGNGGSGTSGENEKVTIRVAASANLTYALDSLVAEFHQHTGHTAHTIVASSGKLTAQIQQGAPFDVFMSANLDYPEELIRSGTAHGPVIEFARGKLIMWSPVGMPLDSGLQSLLSPQVGKVAIAQGRSAPYGIAARAALEADSLWDALRPKLVFGESISQVNQFVATGAADVGLTSASVLHNREGFGGTYAPVSDSLYPAIRQGIVLLDYGKRNHAQAAQAFIEYIQGAEAQQILAHFGYFTQAFSDSADVTMEMDSIPPDSE